jgi:choline-glycine betaine transporter
MDPFVVIILVGIFGFALWFYFKNKKPTTKTLSSHDTQLEKKPEELEQPKAKKKKSKSPTSKKKATKKKKKKASKD